MLRSPLMVRALVVAACIAAVPAAVGPVVAAPAVANPGNEQFSTNGPLHTIPLQPGPDINVPGPGVDVVPNVNVPNVNVACVAVAPVTVPNVDPPTAAANLNDQNVNVHNVPGNVHLPNGDVVDDIVDIVADLNNVDDTNDIVPNVNVPNVN